jgi:hypothetical protein
MCRRTSRRSLGTSALELGLVSWIYLGVSYPTALICTSCDSIQPGATRAHSPPLAYSTLRYITNTPYDMIIYSADFKIVVQGDSLPTKTNVNASSVATSSATTSTSQNLFFQASNTPSSESTPTPTNIVIPPLRPGDVGNIDQPSKSRLGNAAGRIDIEKLKFRVVFILWPALLGVTMAL